MKRDNFALLLTFIIFITAGCATKSGLEGSKYTILGGPENGTFIIFAKGISQLSPERGINLKYKSSKGSYENVRRINAHKDDFAIAFASHIFQSRNGLLKGNGKKYDDIMVLGYLYGGQAHLVTRKNLNINSSQELIGKRVNVGLLGSGSFYHGESFFKEIGIWNKILRESGSDYIAAGGLINNTTEAFWSFSGYPNGDITLAANNSDIILIDLYRDGLSVGFFEKYPYYAKAVIPANTYPGIAEDTQTFQDSALLIAHRDVPNDIVKKLLSSVYSDAGIKRLEQMKDTAKFMRDNNGVFGINTPLHPGAIEYYVELKEKKER